MAVCVAASKAAVQIKCLSTLRARDRDRPRVRCCARSHFCPRNRECLHFLPQKSAWRPFAASAATPRRVPARRLANTYFTPRTYFRTSNSICLAYLIKQVTDSTQPIILMRCRSNASWRRRWRRRPSATFKWGRSRIHPSVRPSIRRPIPIPNPNWAEAKRWQRRRKEERESEISPSPQSHFPALSLSSSLCLTICHSPEGEKYRNGKSIEHGSRKRISDR